MNFKSLLIALVALQISISAHADLVSYEFSGQLTRVSDANGFLHGEFSVGTPFSGHFTYRTDVAMGATSTPPTMAIYSAVTDFYVNINGYEIHGYAGSPVRPGYLQVWDDRIVAPSVVDAFAVHSPLDHTPPISGMGPGRVVASADVYLFDFKHTATKTGVAIPGILNYLDYGSRSFSALQTNVDTMKAFHLDGTISNFALIATPAVPEPETYAMMLAGLGGIGAFARRRKTR